tara:strand:- start:63 stop:281 length:219 start_codon:yes stop_codon:yes gene_type:complete
LADSAYEITFRFSEIEFPSIEPYKCFEFVLISDCLAVTFLLLVPPLTGSTGTEFLDYDFGGSDISLIDYEAP